MWMTPYKALTIIEKNKILLIMSFIDDMLVIFVTLNELHIFFK